MLFILRHRMWPFRHIAFGVIAALVLGGAVMAERTAFPPRYTLTVVDFNLNPSAGNSLFLYQNERQVMQASVFNGTLGPDGAAHFRLPQGNYVIYVTRGMLNTRATPSGALRSASLTVPLRHDTVVDFLDQADVAQRGS